MKQSAKYESQRWFKQAIEDLKTIDVLIQGQRYDVACFIAQQAVEKALKSYLYFKGEEFVFGHSIAKLCTQCSQYDDEFIALKSKIKNLDQFYIETRYPNGLPDEIPAEFFDNNDANLANEKAKTAINFINAKLKFLPNH